MKTSKILQAAAFSLSIASFLTSCQLDADPGPIQQREEEYIVSDFDRVEAGDAFDVTIERGDAWSVKASGDRRNIQDLEVKKVEGTLRIRFEKGDRHNDRQYTTYITITMPYVNGVKFSGAVNARISGFASDNNIDVDLSGASRLDIEGAAKSIDAEVSGASELRGFDFEAETAWIDASGASNVEISATQHLKAKASGASTVRYRGNPEVTASASGASVVEAD